ncbi:MAG: TAXI family TRAP transporter solute-binding subunit [Nitrosomonadaceae bacterium]
MRKRINNYISGIAPKFSVELLQAFLPTLLLVLIGIFIIYKYVDPAPPKSIEMSVSMDAGNYKAFATIYQVLLKENGIYLNLHPSRGTADDIRGLKNSDSNVQMAFIQDGVASAEGSENLVSLGSLYYEPVWIFCRCKKEVTHLSKLKGLKIAIGKDESGTRALSMTLLNSSGINADNAELIPIGGQSAADALRKGEVDAAIFVDMPESALIREISRDSNLRLVNLDQAEAYTRQFPYLHHLVLPEGSLDIANNIPDHDINLLAPTTVLVVRDDVHPAHVYLMLKIVSKVHGGPGLLNKKREFPASLDSDFPLSVQAENFYQNGLPFLDKYLPFWVATFVNRMLIVLIPLLALLIPLIKVIPAAYTQLVKRKLLRYYGELRFLETQIQADIDRQDLEKYRTELIDIEGRVNILRLPVSFSQHLYELKGNIELVRTKLERLITK